VLPCQYLYDSTGAQLFEQICEQPEYYPTRTELGIMESAAFADGVRRVVGRDAHVIELGSGAGLKTERLLETLDAPAAYTPIDISAQQLDATAERLSARFDGLSVLPVAGDFLQSLTLPTPADGGRRVLYFPGSTIGNLEPDAAIALMRSMAGVLRSDDGVLLGYDRVKSPELLVPAYDDACGITAAFAQNLLARLIRELDAQLDVDGFGYRATWEAHRERMRLGLVARYGQTIRIGDAVFELERGEELVTEYSHKYTEVSMARLARSAGLRVRRAPVQRSSPSWRVWYSASVPSRRSIRPTVPNISLTRKWCQSCGMDQGAQGRA
jgi:dimethylhistidine N-methyltransferase